MYGFIRATTGPYYGFVVGCCEAMQNIVYVSATAIPLAEMLVYGTGLSTAYEPMLWIIFYVSSMAINIIGGEVFWKFNLIIGMVSLLLILIYIFGTISYGDFDRYVASSRITRDQPFDGEGMMQSLPLAAWFFIGVESLPLCGRDCSDVSQCLFLLCQILISSLRLIA